MTNLHSVSKTDPLRGAYCPLVVPFRNGKIDFDTYGKLIERQIAEGSHGLLVNATSGEPTTLSVEERGQLVEFVIKVAGGRRPVCAGTARTRSSRSRPARSPPSRWKRSARRSGAGRTPRRSR